MFAGPAFALKTISCQCDINSNNNPCSANIHFTGFLVSLCQQVTFSKLSTQSQLIFTPYFKKGFKNASHLPPPRASTDKMFPKSLQNFFNGKGAVFENFPYHSLTLISSSPRRQTHHLRTHRTGCASMGRGDLAQGHPGGRRGAPGSAATVDRCKNLYHYFHCEI